MLDNVVQMLTQGVTFLGGVLIVFGLINLGMTIKDGMQGGGGQLAGAIAMIVGGAIVVLNPVETIAHAGLERNRQHRAKSRCVIRLDFESGNGILCDLDRIRALMRQTRTQHEMFLFREMVGRPVDPMALHPIRVFTTARSGARRAA